MYKIGEFIYPWGNGHYSRMMRLDHALREELGEIEVHYLTKSPIYEKLVKKFPDQTKNIHEILMPTPIDGKFGPSITLSMLNMLLPVAENPSLVRQVVDYLRKERKLYDTEKFDLVINDGDMGSNILAKNRNIPSLFVTNQFRPKLWKSRAYFYPALVFVSEQIAKADKILVADSAPPYTLCEYNLNFPKKIQDKIHYIGHFASAPTYTRQKESDLELLIKDQEFGYWMRTGNKSTNEGTGQRYTDVFAQEEMKSEKRIISHAINDPTIDCVMSRDKQRYSITEAYEKKIDWIQIDVGFLSEQQKDAVLNQCRYAVVNGSHTVMGEIMGNKSKPIIGMPIYDEHTNQIRWAQEKNLGVLAKSTKEVIDGIAKIRDEYETFEEGLAEFSDNFDGNGAKNAAKIAAETLQNKK